jgi:hypothetical protein
MRFNSKESIATLLLFFVSFGSTRVQAQETSWVYKALIDLENTLVRLDSTRAMP